MMTEPPIKLKAGARSSPLAVAQTTDALERWQSASPCVTFEFVRMESPGDRDRRTDLRETDPDFFTRDLDDGVLDGTLDLAVHSAKDVPENLREGLDWFWLPWRADPRDVVVMRQGESPDALPEGGRIGISSDRREHWAKEFHPEAQHISIRGNIESRLEQLDRGDVDLLLMAGAALLRLGLEDRITRWIPLSEIPVPEGQGFLCVTFRSGDERIQALRAQFVKPAVLAGAGPGDAGLLTGSAARALERCDVCLHDALVSAEVLKTIPGHVRLVNVGKRCGKHYMTQAEISLLLADTIRKGFRVVRLKGGDPGLYGRVPDETATLQACHLPYRVLPGVSSLCAATSGTGLLLTRRGVSRGFTVMTPRMAGGESEPVSMEHRQGLPLALFMGVSRIAEMAGELIEEGRSPDEPVCVALSVGMPEEELHFATLSTVSSQMADLAHGKPGIMLVGKVAAERFLFQHHGSALEGQRVMVTCSGSIQDQILDRLEDAGGSAVVLPMIESELNEHALPALADVSRYDWVAVTSPGAVHRLMEGLAKASVDVRSLPGIMTCGPGCTEALAKYGVRPDVVPTEDYGRAGLLAIAGDARSFGSRVLRLKSDHAGDELSQGLRDLGFEVDDCELYSTVALAYDRCPEFDAVLFCSGSAVRSFISNFGKECLRDRTVVVIGRPTRLVLEAEGIDGALVAYESTGPGCVEALMIDRIQKRVREAQKQDGKVS